MHDRIRKVHTHHGAHMLANASAHGEKGAERLYSIVFEVDKLWREASGLPEKASARALFTPEQIDSGYSRHFEEFKLQLINRIPYKSGEEGA